MGAAPIRGSWSPIVLAAQPRRLFKLGNRLLELADLRIDLEGWESDDTAAFVKKALAEAGRTTPVFSEAALHSLHELASGIPRRVKQLADLALLAVRIRHAEYWDVRESKMVQLLKMAKAAVTHEPPHRLGEHKELTLP